MLTKYKTFLMNLNYVFCSKFWQISHEFPALNLFKTQWRADLQLSLFAFSIFLSALVWWPASRVKYSRWSLSDRTNDPGGLIQWQSCVRRAALAHAQLFLFLCSVAIVSLFSFSIFPFSDDRRCRQRARAACKRCEKRWSGWLYRRNRLDRWCSRG